jgi:tetratricopeptide (TPR) repeat protein
MGSAGALLEDGERSLERGHAARAWDLATLGLARDPRDTRDALLDLQARAARARAAPSAAPPYPSEVARASAAVKQGRLDDAIALLDQAIARLPDCAAAHAVRGMALLSAGRFREGFAAYEWRHRLPGFEGDHSIYPQSARTGSEAAATLPPWDGGPLEGGTLLLWDEQGFGDTIQFARFTAPAARASRARVVLLGHPRICRLLRGCPGVDAVVARGQGVPPADAQLSLMSLPAVLGLGIDGLRAARSPVVVEPALATFWRNHLDRITAPGRPRIGLAWQGNPRHPEDSRRSLPLAALAPLIERGGDRTTFVSLQKEAARDALAASGLPIVDLGAELDLGPDAFVDTSAAIAALDLVITTDTAIAHLAATLGAPTWVLLARPCDWRWGLDDASTPFYPTARLFRQPTPGRWAPVIAAAADALAAIVARPAPRAIPLEVSAGDLLDRLTILEIRVRHAAAGPGSRGVADALERARAAWRAAGADDPRLAPLIGELKAINGALWDAEDEIRARERRQDHGPDFVAVARAICRLNDRRAAVKRAIDERCGFAPSDDKIYVDGRADVG